MTLLKPSSVLSSKLATYWIQMSTCSTHGRMLVHTYLCAGIGEQDIDMVRLFLHLFHQRLNSSKRGNVCWSRVCLAFDWQLIERLDSVSACVGIASGWQSRQ